VAHLAGAGRLDGVSEYQVDPMTQREKIDWMLETAGWAAIPVPPIEDPAAPRAGYTYTIGLESRFGHPEVVVFGLAPAPARNLLELVIGQIKAGVELPVSQPFVGLLDGGLRAMLAPVPLDEHRPLFGELADVYGDQDWRVLQFVWPDRSGAFPWEEGWPHHLRLTQPIIGR
jgi:hypothetical protein